MKIYTRTGDKGETGLIGGARVRKDDPRVAAYGEVDELNCALGVVLSQGVEEPVRATLLRVQKELFVVGAFLADPKGKQPPPPVPDALEKEIDQLTAELPALQTFILPSGAQTGSMLHLARAVCRRAERAATAIGAGSAPKPEAVIYLNRLSDYLFTAARWVNHKQGRIETPWP